MKELTAKERKYYDDLFEERKKNINFSKIEYMFAESTHLFPSQLIKILSNNLKPGQNKWIL